MTIRQLFPVFLFMLFILFTSLNILVRGVDAYPIIRFIPFVISISLGIITALSTANVYGLASGHGKAITTVAAGMSFILFGDVSFAVLQLSGQAVPLPSFADALYAIGYLFFLVGFYWEIAIYGISWKTMPQRHRVLIAATTALVGAAVLYVEFFSTYDSTLTVLANLARASYGIFDFLLIIPALLILRMAFSFGEGQFLRPWMAILLGILSSMSGDFMYALNVQNYLAGNWPYTMLNMFWVSAYLLASYGFSEIGFILSEAQQKIRRK